MDVGLTHVALPVCDLDESAGFYARFARMQVVHRREGVIWLSDNTRPFDRIGDLEDAVKVLEGLAGIRESRVVTYHRSRTGVELLPRRNGAGSAHVEEDPRGAMELRDDYPLGAVDDDPSGRDLPR